KKNKEINKHASLEIKHMLGHVNTDLTQNPNNMSIHKIHEDPITPQTIKLPLWQQSTKKEGNLILSWRRRGLPAGSGGELSGGVVGVVVRPVVVDRRRLLLDRSRRSSRSSWSSGRSWRGDDRGVRRRSRRDGSQVWLSGAHDGRTEDLGLRRRVERE